MVKKIWKISILVKIVGNSRLVQTYQNFDLDKIAVNVDCNQNFGNMSIWVNICKYLDFGQNFRKISILSKFANMLILVKKYPKILFFVKIFRNIDFSENCRNISNLVKFVEKSRFWTKLSKILDFGQVLAKCRSGSKDKVILILVRIFKKTLILPKIFEKILVRIFKKFRFWSNLSKILDFGQILIKCRFWSKYK